MAERGENKKEKIIPRRRKMAERGEKQEKMNNRQKHMKAGEL